MNDIYVSCADGSFYWIDPTDGATLEGGQAGPIPPLFYQHASYRGREQLPGIDKCFWNVALGIDLSAVADIGSCHLEASGTASNRAGADPLAPDYFGADDDPNTLQLYPYIHWSIDLTTLVDDEGRIACNRNPLGCTESGTTVEYLELTDTPFQHTFECQNGTTSRDPELCSRQLEGYDVAVQSIVDGFFVEVNGNRSELYALPDGLDIPDCCPTPCEDCNGGTP
jgi:hypothetical protein